MKKVQHWMLIISEKDLSWAYIFSFSSVNNTIILFCKRVPNNLATQHFNTIDGKKLSVSVKNWVTQYPKNLYIFIKHLTYLKFALINYLFDMKTHKLLLSIILHLYYFKKLSLNWPKMRQTKIRGLLINDVMLFEGSRILWRKYLSLCKEKCDDG